MNNKKKESPAEVLLETTELPLVAALQCFGFGIQTVEKDSKGRAVFSFRGEDNLDKFVKKYWDQKLRVEPQKYFQATKAIKSRIYNDLKC
jgi:hypothetical protein